MDENNIQFQKDFLVNMQLNIITSAYTHCWEYWRDIDYTPDYNKFYFICDGEGLIKIGDQEYYPRKGQMVLMPAGVIQSYSTINKNTFKKYWCHFTAKIGDINLFDFFDIPYLINVDDYDKLKCLFQELILLQENQTLFNF
jgi:AraC family transcriptional regulator, arabinose operon regulatory protein